MKSQTRMLMASVIVIALALTAVSGITYSWFSDTEKAQVDITAGTLDIEMTTGTIEEDRIDASGTSYQDVQFTASVQTSNHQITITIDNFSPGDRVTIPMSIKNVGSLKAQVALTLSGVVEGEIEYSLIDDGEEVTLDEYVQYEAGAYVIGSDSADASLTILMPTTNETQGKEYGIILTADALQIGAPTPENASIYKDSWKFLDTVGIYPTDSPITYISLRHELVIPKPIEDITITAINQYNNSYTFKDKTILGGYHMSKQVSEDVKVTCILDGDLTGVNLYYDYRLSEENDPKQIYGTYDPLTCKTTIGFTITNSHEYCIILADVDAIIDGKYATVSDYSEAISSASTFKLLNNIFPTEAIEVSEDADVTLDINGRTIGNLTSGHTLINNGTLTIKNSSSDDFGCLANRVDGSAVVYNSVGAVLTIDSGNFQKIGSSYYNIKNLGTCTINGGTFSGDYLCNSMVVNGFNDSKEYDNAGATQEAVMTINGGDFTYNSGNNITVKNDMSAQMIINGGTFKSTSKGVVANWDELTINGGVFKCESEDGFVIRNGEYNSKDTGNADGSGELVITGGTFSGSTFLKGYYEGMDLFVGGSVTISGATINGTASSKLTELKVDCENQPDTHTAHSLTKSDGVWTWTEQTITEQSGTSSSSSSSSSNS